MDVYVAIDGGVSELVATVTASSPNAQGIYSGSASYQGRADGLAHTYRFFSIGRDSAGNIESAPTGNSDVFATYTFAASALKPTGIDVQLGAAQRSYIRYLDVLFSAEQGLSNLLLLNPFKIERFALNATDVTPGTGSSVAFEGVTKVADRLRVDFGINGITGSRTSNTGDGFYRVLVDGNGDGDYLDAVDAFFEFHRILGDANGDAVVDQLDLNLINSQSGRTGSNLNGDIDGSGAVNALDFSRTNTQKNLNRNLTLPLRPLLDD